MDMFYMFVILLACVACVLCTSEALNGYIETGEMNWGLLVLGITNGILGLINSYILMSTIR